MARNIPNLNPKFVCIVDHKRQDLAAVISSYISEKNNYPLIFEFPTVTSANYERVNEDVDENVLSLIRAGEFVTFVNNILVRIQPIDNLIIAGLSEEQKSFLDFLKHFNVIEINNLEEVDFLISPFIVGKGKIQCRHDDLLKGLNAALRSNSTLVLNDDAQDIELKNEGDKGMILVETEPFVATIIAINYAFSIDADIAFVNRVSEDERLDIQDKFVKFGEGNKKAGDEIRALINKRISHVDFAKSEFVTYFTTGMPYSFASKNSLPSTYVNSHLRPDLFIANNLLFHGSVRFGGAVVFSPEFFKDEETELVGSLLIQKNYFVKELVGKDANILNLDMNIRQFPFDVFHICSHGGEIDGHSVEEDFTDSKGAKHNIVYEQVLSFSPSLRPGLVTVQRKDYFKRFDGYIWRSPELKAQKFPPYIFSDMQNALRHSKAKDKKVGPKKKINNSCAIQCSDGPHLAMFTTVASQSSPFIFNNTCWSWYHIAEPFLVSGANSYIGTLWNVENKAAISFASEFYKTAFSNSVMDAAHRSMKKLAGSSSEDIYVVWGLHFTKLASGKNSAISREAIFEELMRSLGVWQYNLKSTKLKSTRDSIADFLKWIYSEINSTFSLTDYELFKKKLQENKMKNTGK
ncbi:MAG TPA: CHAT domain-containing protein [Chitinophagaceae bacterium]